MGKMPRPSCWSDWFRYRAQRDHSCVPARFHLPGQRQGIRKRPELRRSHQARVVQLPPTGGELRDRVLPDARALIRDVIGDIQGVLCISAASRSPCSDTGMSRCGAGYRSCSVSVLLLGLLMIGRGGNVCFNQRVVAFLSEYGLLNGLSAILRSEYCGKLTRLFANVLVRGSNYGYCVGFASL